MGRAGRLAMRKHRHSRSDLSRSLAKAKWEELNHPTLEPEPNPEPASEPVRASWDECEKALKRAMEADNLRPSYVKEAMLTFGAFR